MESYQNPLIMLPGPVAIHPRIYEAMARPIIGGSMKQRRGVSSKATVFEAL